MLAGCSLIVGNRGDGDGYSQWTFVKRNHSWWGWEWCRLSTGAKELKVLWCGRDCSLILIYHGSSARRRDSYRTQPDNSDAAGTFLLCAEQRSWGGKAGGDFFSFAGKSGHSDRRKDAETLGPCHCIPMSSIWAGGTSGCVRIWVQEYRNYCYGSRDSSFTQRRGTGRSQQTGEVVRDSSAIKRHLHLEMSPTSQAIEAHPARNADGYWSGGVRFALCLPCDDCGVLYSSFTDDKLEVLSIFTSENLSTMQKQQQPRSQSLAQISYVVPNVH